MKELYPATKIASKIIVLLGTIWFLAHLVEGINTMFIQQWSIEHRFEKMVKAIGIGVFVPLTLKILTEMAMALIRAEENTRKGGPS